MKTCHVCRTNQGVTKCDMKGRPLCLRCWELEREFYLVQDEAYFLYDMFDAYDERVSSIVSNIVQQADVEES